MCVSVCVCVCVCVPVTPVMRIRRDSADSGTLVSSVSAADSYTGVQAVGEADSSTNLSSATVCEVCVYKCTYNIQ